MLNRYLTFGRLTESHLSALAVKISGDPFAVGVAKNGSFEVMTSLLIRNCSMEIMLNKVTESGFIPIRINGVNPRLETLSAFPNGESHLLWNSHKMPINASHYVDLKTWIIEEGKAHWNFISYPEFFIHQPILTDSEVTITKIQVESKDDFSKEPPWYELAGGYVVKFFKDIFSFKWLRYWWVLFILSQILGIIYTCKKNDTWACRSFCGQNWL